MYNIVQDMMFLEKLRILLNVHKLALYISYL